MMVGVRAMLILVAGFILCTSANASVTSSKGAKSVAANPELIQHFTAVRMEYAERPDYSSMWEIDEEREAVMDVLKEDRISDFLSLSERWLKKCPVDAPVHFLRASQLEETGDPLAAVYHRMMFYGLLMSLLASGDGKTEASAYKVISVAEEYMLLDYMNARVKRQGLRGHCDVMEVERDGKNATLYFDASIALQSLDKKLSDKTKKP